MAEAAVVEERPTVPTRYYCHMCNVEINIPNTDYTCPLCAGGFVEELPAAALAQAGTSGSSGSSLATNTSDGERGGGGGGAGLNRFSDLNALRGEIATLLMSRNGPNVEISIDPEHLPRRVPGSMAISLGGGGGGSGSSTSSNTGGGRVRPQNLDRLDNVLLDFLQSLSGVDVETPYGNTEMFFLGNLGDYAWGREGIDTIVTQLLNQMETSGPPPLAKEKIAEIPKVEITNEEVERKLQCSVCWEDFRLQELVRKLPCSHIYHENCIVPWLDLHGTCPICRKSLTDDEADVDNGDAAMINSGSQVGMGEGTATNTCPMHRNVNNDVGARGSGGAVDATAVNINNVNAPGAGANTSQHQQQQQQQQRNNVFGFDDGNVDLD